MKKILIVEDDADINRALTIRLESAGYRVLSAQDGLIGLTTAVKERPDIMILDISMPAGDGFSIVERLRASSEGGEIPFIMLTASKRPEFRQLAEELGAFAYFEKPYESAALLEKVSEAVSGGRRLNV